MPGSTLSGASVYAGVPKSREEKVKEVHAWVDEVARRGVPPSEFVYASDWHARLGPARPDLRHERGTVPEVAMRHSRYGHSVAIVNAACAYNAGGGFLSGGRHALEEFLCAQSTLLPSLQVAVERAGRQRITDSKLRRLYIPEKGVVLSRGVELLRDGPSAGYAELPEPVWLAGVVSVAMPNRNGFVRDSPVDTRRGTAYEKVVSAKFVALLSAVSRCNANVLVIPDVGCGVFQNDPREVGRLFGIALRERGCGVQTVICTGAPAFHAKAVAALNGSTREETSRAVVVRHAPSVVGAPCSFEGLRDDFVTCFSFFTESCFGRSKGLRR